MLGVGKYLDAERDNIKANTKQIEQDTVHSYLDGKNLKEQLRGLIISNNILDSTGKDNAVAVINKLESEKEYTDAQTSQMKEITLNYQQERKESDARIDLLKKQKEQAEEAIKLAKTEEEKNAAQTQLNNVTTELVSAQKDRQLLDNKYESELQEVGQSTSNSSNPAVNAANVAAVNAARVAKKSSGVQSSGHNNLPHVNPQYSKNNRGDRVVKRINRNPGKGKTPSLPYNYEETSKKYRGY